MSSSATLGYPHEEVFSDEQIISILREAVAGVSARELCRKNAISDATFYTGRRSLVE
jgi:putative transposase